MDWLKKLLSVTRRTCFHETYVHGSYLTVAAQKKGTEQFHLNPTLLPQSLPLKLLVSHRQRKRSVVLSFPTPLCHVRAVQTAVCFQPPKRFSFPFHDPFKNLMLLPLSICCRNSCAVTRSWGCRTGLYSCLVFEPFCFKQEHSLIRAKHSFMLCTSSEDIFWTKATKSRSSCMHRPHSWPILAPTAAKKKPTQEEMERDGKKKSFFPACPRFALTCHLGVCPVLQMSAWHYVLLLWRRQASAPKKLHCATKQTSVDLPVYEILLKRPNLSHAQTPSLIFKKNKMMT